MKNVSKSILWFFFIIFILICLFSFYEWYWHKQHNQLIVFKDNNVKVIDGNTIMIDDKTLLLKGIEAPKPDQVCKYSIDQKPIDFECGKLAKLRLELMTLNKLVECTDEGKDLYGRTLSNCFVDNKSLNREMIKKGLAMADRPISMLQ